MSAHHPLFDEALAAIDSGDPDRLRELLARSPELVRARATSASPPYDGYFHGATLLHHIAGNPVRGSMPSTIVDVARLLLDAGADPEATCGGGPSQPATSGGTVMGLVTSGAQPHIQGHTEALIDLLLEYGAKLDPDGGMFGALYHTVEHRGQREVARMLHDRGVRADLPIASGLGRLDLVRSFFRHVREGPPSGRTDLLVEGAAEIWSRTVRGGATLTTEQILADALLAASVNGWCEVVAWLLDRGANVDALRSWGPFPVTPLHGAAWAGWPEVVTLLLSRGADATAPEPTFDATPFGWALHSERGQVLDAFRKAGIER